MKTISALFGGWWTVAMFLLTPAQAQAQSPPQAESQGLETIVVTAQRREQNIQDVPMSIAAFTGASLQAAQIDTTEGLSLLVPGMNMGRHLQSISPFIRGVGNQDTGAGNEASVALYVDGVYIASQSASLLSLYDVERVEVLKGPQGTLFGRNATGGLIQVVTKDPEHEPTVSVEAGYGNFQTTEANLYASTGLSPVLAANISAHYLYQNQGYGDNLPTANDTDREHEASVRSKWVLDLDKVKFTLAGDFSQVSTTLGLARQALPGTLLTDHVTGFPGSIYDTTWGLNPAVTTRQYGGSLAINANLDWANFVSISAARDTHPFYALDQDAAPANIFTVIIHEFSRTLSQEFQLLSPKTESLEWIVGAYFYHADVGNNGFQISGAAVAPLAQINRVDEETTKSYAGFAQATYKITPKTNLTAGVRYTSDRRQFEGTEYHDATLAANTPAFSVDESKTWSKPTWRLALDQKLSDDSMAYLTYNRGFKSGIYNPTNLKNPPVNPENLDAVELGLKSDFLNSRLRLNTSTFWYSYKDIQLTEIQAGVSTIYNAAAARIYGAEVDLQDVVTDRLSLEGNASWLHTEYTDFPNAPHSFPKPNGGDTLISSDASGNEMIRAPKYTFNLLADYKIPLASGSLQFNVLYYYNGGFFWEVDNRLSQGAFGLLNSGVDWNLNKHFKVGFWGKNLLDKQYYLAVQSSSVGDFGSAAPPRTYGVNFNYKM